MKNSIFLLSMFVCFQVVSQRKPKIKGNRNVIEVTKDLPAFHTIHLIDDLEVSLNHASKEGYVLNSDDNLVDILKFKVEDSVLTVSSFYKITSKKKLDIIINYSNLSKLVVRDGKLKMDRPIQSEELIIETFGSAKVDLQSEADFTKIIMEGNSSGDFNVRSDTLSVILKDRVDASVYSISKQTLATLYSTSSLKGEGTAVALSARLFDKSSVKAQKLQVENVEVIASGSTSAKVYASKNFQLSAEGSSKTYLSGDAKIEILKFTDVSELHKED